MFLSVFYILEEKAFGKAIIESACDLRRSSKTFNTFSAPAFETVWCFLLLQTNGAHLQYIL